MLIKFSPHCECLIELNEAGQLSPVGWFADDISNMVWCYIQFTSDRYRLCKNNSAHLNSFYARCFSNPNASLLNAAFSCLIKHTVLTRGITHQEDLEWQKGKGKKAWDSIDSWFSPICEGHWNSQVQDITAVRWLCLWKITMGMSQPFLLDIIRQMWADRLLFKKKKVSSHCQHFGPFSQKCDSP